MYSAPVASPEATERARAEASRRPTGAFELVARRGWTALLLAAFVALPLAWLVRRSLAGYGTVPLPVDLMVFLNAADDILAGRNPFPTPAAFTGDANYVYPPLLAIVAIPLAVLPVAPAVLIWTLLSAGAIAAALWLLGVRDWRVYGLCVLLAGTRDAIAAGTVGPLLVLGSAIAWRYRDRRPALAGAGVGLAIALKLFVWPLLLWLVVTRRARTALLAFVIGGGAALASWAVIGFDGLTDYPDLLRRLSDLEADQSYSMYAVGRAVGLASPLAVGSSLAVGAIFLAIMVWTARDVAIPATERDRLALTAAIAASLALTPILWIHYLVLLIVPLALARPRFAPLWLVALVPAAVRIIGWSPAGWPSGDPPSLAVVLGTTVLVLAWMLRPVHREAPTLRGGRSDSSPC
jgi:alpha-1,2-mannosyltransferase